MQWLMMMTTSGYQKLKWIIKRKNHRTFYAQNHFIDKNGKNTTRTMHRYVMRMKNKRIQIDHIDCDGLNNQKSNLRKCNTSMNCANVRTDRKNNKTGYKGVMFREDRNVFTAQIMVNKKSIYLGYHLDPKEAAKMYNEAAKKYFGEFARLNQL